MRTRRFLATAIVALTIPLNVMAQKPSVYPGKGQSAAQKDGDDKECLAWAKQDTGIDPAVVAATPPPPSGPKGERLRGAARGAAAGAVLGEVLDDDAGKGAAAGATVGVLAGGRKARQNQAASVQQSQALQSQSLHTYYSAYGACMEGRGYTVQ